LKKAEYEVAPACKTKLSLGVFLLLDGLLPSVAGTTRISCLNSSAASATMKLSAHVSTTTRLGSRVFKKFGSSRVLHRVSSTIAPSADRTQICDSRPPKSIATCSMAGLLRVRL
jgi:hypothetical protein